jgi:hypothetical protein
MQNFYVHQKKKDLTYSFSRNTPSDSMNISSEVIFIYLKTKGVVNFWEVQTGGYVLEVLYSIESMCYSV